MSYRLLLDENVEHEVFHRLESKYHDIEHVDFVPTLEKGTSDEMLAQYSVENDRTIVTYDDDFIGTLSDSEYRAVIFFEDDTMSAREVAEILHVMSTVYPHDAVHGLQKAGKEWL